MANCNMEDTFGSSKTTVSKTDQHTSVKKDDENDAVVHKEMNTHDGKIFIDKFFEIPEEDNDKFLRKIRTRMDKAGIDLPKVEVRFQNLSVEGNCLIGDRALPTLPNVAWNVAESALSGCLGIKLAGQAKHMILKDASGIIKPARMTLLLGPPSSGKTTLLLALAGMLNSTLKVTGEITYNGYRLDEFVPQKTSSYISQTDIHDGQMTVKETLNFSSRCQGVGPRYELLTELERKEKEAGIVPDPEVSYFMKQTATGGVENCFITEYTLKILGLDKCRDTIVGNEMHRGISGGEKKRVTIGEMIVGPTKTLFMDDISTGLDSSTAFQIVKCLQQIVHQTEATVLTSLLQPDPEIFNLFDDIILLSEGQIVYQGPREHVIDFFESCGFKCPERKGIADYLQEVTSKKNQEHYWADRTQTYKYISVVEFAARFESFHVGLRLADELCVKYDKDRMQKGALVFKKDLVSQKELLKTIFGREWLLFKRNSFIYAFKLVHVIILAFITATVFMRTTSYTRNEDDGAAYIGALTFVIMSNMFTGFSELAIIMQRLPVFFKQRDHLFYPLWTVTLPTFVLNIPVSLLESTVWLAVTYYTIGFAPEASRFFTQLFLVFLIQQMAAGSFRVVCGVGRTNVVANTGGSLALLLLFLLGFILPRDEIPNWLDWAYWFSPIPYAFSSLASNEMLSPRWTNKMASDNVTSLGVAVLKSFNFSANPNWVWVSAAALLGFAILFNILFTFALTFLRNREIAIQQINESNFKEASRQDSSLEGVHAVNPKRGMVLPFTALNMSFNAISYFVDMPPIMKEKGMKEDKLQLLEKVTGAFKPGVLTALMGVTGAGKTTLLDVLSGRKTGGHIEGDIRISGFPKRQETFARISGYCEQNDIHSPQVTVHESLIYSAFLRLPTEVSKEEKMMFIDEVISLVELDNLKDAIVGLPGITGLSTEQRKRLTIAVELVANPSIIFMDEPTSGLDARAAAIVMRTVRNTVDTGRTVVCTIHQPSIDIFEAFDELLLLKSRGQVIYHGPLGRNSHTVIRYFEEITGVPKIKEEYNPATWMLEVSSVATEHRLGVDFARHYKSSALYQRNKVLVEQLSKPSPGANDLHFPTKYPQSTWKQLESCLWKQWVSYWRSPDYNLVRYFFTLTSALIVGTVFWKVGERKSSHEQLTRIIGSMYNSMLFIGINNCLTVQPMVAVERTVFYRERAAGMYSSIPYAMAQVCVEIPYVFIQTICYTIIVYPMVGFEGTVTKVCWFFFINFFTFLYFIYYGMMTVSITPNPQLAAIVSSTFFSLFNLFSGFYIPKPDLGGSLALPPPPVGVPTGVKLQLVDPSDMGDVKEDRERSTVGAAAPT
ncbi:hypothetical protein ACET3Z_007646 [Daucus carota]